MTISELEDQTLWWLIRDWKEENGGRAPTLREISVLVHKGTTATHRRLKRLARKGWITMPQAVDRRRDIGLPGEQYVPPRPPWKEKEL